MPTVEEQATGCVGANSYKEYARSRGYTHVEVFDWTSSAGDWTFIVSKDGEGWFLLFQSNQYPRRGFHHTIDLTRAYYGTKDEVLGQLWDECHLD